MSLKRSILLIVLIGCAVFGGQPKAKAASNNLLFRMQFAGASMLGGNTNVAYITNFSSLPETTAFGGQIVKRVATLPARLLAPSRSNNLAELFQPMFAQMLKSGFTLELRGNHGTVTEFALAAKSNPENLKLWESSWRSAVTNWAATTKLAAKHSGDWLLIAGSKSDPASALAAIQKSAEHPDLKAGELLRGQLASSLLPSAIQRSVYGGFETLRLSVTPEDQSLKIRGSATYSYDLPKLGPPPAIPQDLITETAVSFTLVREPGAWLDSNSVLRPFLPAPIPDVAFFWGGQSSPYQFFMALPFAGQDRFATQFGPAMMSQLQPVLKNIEFSFAELETNNAALKIHTIPFMMPKVQVKQSATNSYLVAEMFPGTEEPVALTPALLERISNRANLVLYDWEYTQLRFDTWFRIGQLALLLSGHQQHIANSPSLRLMQKIQINTTTALNTSTEITQAGPRELTLKRSAPLAFTSLELFWLANWLESANFPAANFLIPIPETSNTPAPSPTPQTPKNP